MAAVVRLPRLSKKAIQSVLPHRRGFTNSRNFRMLHKELSAPNGICWTQPLGLFINNEFVESEGGHKITTIDPYTEKEICSVHAAKQADVDKAVKAAKNALKNPAWKNLSGTQRGQLMHKLADLVEKQTHLLATIETMDNGKPFGVSRDYDVPQLCDVLRYYAGFADKIFGSVIDVGPQKLAYTVKQPIGVCGQIIPWNYPLMMAAWKLGPALCCGNTVVLKLAEQTPLSMLYLGQLIRQSGFPPGVINIINGLGPEAGAALAQHPDVNKIAFTGSTVTGRKIMRMASETMKPITLEMGGKSPLLVFDDADLEEAVKWSHAGIMDNQGQVCCATSRILVQEAIYDAFMEKFEAYTARTTVLGDPFDEKTTQGPQVTQVQKDRVMSYIHAAKENSSINVIHPNGKKDGSVPSCGYFAPPTFFANVHRSSPLFHEEIFGPCAVIVKFKTEEEALELANLTDYGLASAIFTMNIKRAHRVAAELEAGMVWVNSSNDSDYRIPFGGIKQSGIGRENGESALKNYFQEKAVHVNLNIEI